MHRLKQFSIGWLLATSAFAAPPDLTQPGGIAGISRSETYNLGATGMRGWIAIDSNGRGDVGLITDQSRQILVTHCVAPANAVLAVDDVILGAVAASSGTVPDFTTDCRKAFANAITDAEKTGAGTLRVKRWRAGTVTDQNIPIAILGNYNATAPFNSCPKSTAILNNVRNKMVADLLADPNYLTTGFGGACSGLALLSGVKPGDPDYNAVQTRLQTFARAQATRGAVGDGIIIWEWSYMLIFLSEYYLLTNDAQVVSGILNFTLALSEAQSYYGTYGHEVCVIRDDSGRRTSRFYGPVNAVGGTAIIALALGKKALVAAGQPIAPEIETAINRSTGFFSFYVNKGSVPYGEHEPAASSHASNGKDAMPAIFFSLLPGRAVETEYFARMSIAGWIGREYGHTGQGLSYYWTTLGALMGGPDAASEHLKQVRWHLDLSRRTDGSFAYDGREQFGPGTTNTYLGVAGYDGMSANATYLLTYSMPFKRLWITGKNADPAHTLDSTKIANAVAAGSYPLEAGAKTTPELFAALGEYDPAVRHFASRELSTRTLSGTDLTNLRNLLTSSDRNLRQSACQVLGLLQDATALPTIVGMLNDSDVWVRNKAAQAIRSYPFTQAQADAHLVSMMNSFINNATDPSVIVWDDPIQTSNGNLSQALFGDGVLGNGYNVSQYTINANRPSPLYDAIRVGLRQPDSYPRMGVIKFAKARLSVADLQALYPEVADTVKYEPPADRMWGPACRGEAISFMTAMNITEGIPLALAMLEEGGYGSGAGDFHTQALNGLASYGDAARYTLPILKGYLKNPTTALINAITTIENAITAPAQSPGLCVASPQVVTTTGVKAITLSGASPRGAFSFLNVTQPTHGTLSGTAPNLTYTPTPGYTGPDQFTFQTADALTTSTIATVGIVVGPSGNGIPGEYFNNANFTNSVITRTDPQINFDWASASPHASISPDTFSTRWSGVLLIPESASYTFSALTSDGVRVYLNGQLIIDRFTDQTTHWSDSTPIQLTAGQMVDITMEYYENTGNAVAKLKWTGPGFAGRNGGLIPQAYLFQGIANRPCYAFAQNLNAIRNTALPLTLGGSSGSGGTLSYHILNPPANGTLSGMAPNLTYTPNNNFAGTDSFTFLVNNGISNSQPATILINVESGPLTSFIWTSATDGNWNDPARWTPSAPAAAGQANYALHFSTAGTYTATHNLNSGFQLNQLHFSGSTTLAGTQSIAFSANGGTMPRLLQNSSGTVLINPPLTLQSTLTLAGNGTGQITFAGIVSGAGGIIKDAAGTLRINQNYNTYSGGTTLSAGRVIMPAGPGSTTFALGTGPITVNSGAILELNQSKLTNVMNLSGGTIMGGNSFTSTLSGPVTLNNTTTINLDDTGGFEITGPISGSGGFTSTHSYWKLSGSNSHTGSTTIQNGWISYQSAASVAPGPLVIISPGKANLNFSGNRVIASLTLGGVVMSPGTYGSSNQAAYFTGTGTVTVLPPSTCSLDLTAGSSPATPGTALTFTATVTGNAPTGNVSFYAGSTLLGTSALNGAFQAGFTTSSLAVGAYEITARYAGNANNATSTSAPLPIEIASNLPVTPANLVAQPNNNQVRLLWTASPGATSYRVKRSLTNGGPYTEIATTATASYMEATVPNGTTYHYVVAATNAFGDSADSPQISVTAYTVTLDKQSGSGGSNSIAVIFADAMPAATAPTRAGYSFGGYYTAESGGGTEYYTAAMASPANWNIAANTTLYALWINSAPIWTGNPITGTSATEGSAYSATLVGSASDVDPGASLSFAKVSGPAWLTVGANGALSGTPASGDGGANSFLVSVSDGIAPAVQTTLNITVNFPSFTWDTDAAGNWTDITKWLGDAAYASGINANATFDNVITANRSITLDANRTIGSIVAADGTHDYTISGASILTLDRTGLAIPVINVTPAGRALTISSVIHGNDGLDKWGAGQLILNGSAVNSFTGGVKISSGTLNLNFANLATPADLLNSGNSLTLSGGTLLITGKSATNTSQSLGNVTVNAGGGRILVNPSDSSRTATLNLGSITPAVTGTLLVGKSSGSSGTATITTTSGTLANGIYGGRMVYFNGTANTGYDWATTASADPGPYTISGLGTYTTLPISGGLASTNYQMTASTTLTGGFPVNTIKMAPAATANVALDLGGNTLTVEGGGLLFTGSGTGNVINNGNVTAGAGSNYKLRIHNYNSQFHNTAANNSGINAAITNNGLNPVAVVVTGNPGGTSGLFRLGNTSNSFTGGLYLNNASIQLGGAGAINGNTIYASGYSVLYNPTFSTISAIDVADGAMLDFRNNVAAFSTTGAVTGKGGIVLGQAGGGATPLNFNSTGNTFTGPIEYRVIPNGQNGTLSVNSIGDAEFLGSGDIRFGVAGTGTNVHIFTFGGSAGAPSGPLTFNKRRFELAGTHALSQINNNSAQNFTINTNLLASGTGTMTLTLGGTGAGLSTFAGTISNGSLTTLGLTKADAASTWTLTNTGNSYTGITTITAGKLQVSALANGGSNSSIGTSTNAAANLVFGAPAATLRYAGGSHVTIDRGFTMSSGADGGATIESSGAGTLSFDNTVAIAYGTPSQTRLLTLGGTNTGDNTFGKLIANNTSATSLTKAGTGTWILTNTNTYTGTTAVSGGKLFVDGDQTSANGAVSVAANATLGGTGTIGGNITIADMGKLEFNLSTAPGSHDPLELVTGMALTFSGASTLTITSSGPEIPGTYTLITGGNNITGVAPAAVILPPGWTADAPTISGNSLLLNVTSTGPTYTVTYHSNNATSGTVPSVQTKNHNVSLNLATNTGNLARAGFTFSGWNTQAGGSGTNYAVAGTYTANTSFTLYAKWIMTFDNWSGGADFGTDSNGDGTKDGMAWLLGASNKDTNAASRLPVASSTGDNLQLNFTCIKVANRGSTTLKLQVSDDLGVNDPWTNQEVLVPDTSGTVGGVVFTISANADPNLCNVQASIPNGVESKFFARLIGAH